MKTLGLSERNSLDINIQDKSLSIFLVEDEDIREKLIPRPTHAHKGMMGHALLVSGQYGMAGATILAAKACMRSGVGKLTVHTAGKNNNILQCCVPEAILSHDKSDCHITESIPTSGFDAVAIGPGMGTKEETATAFLGFLSGGCSKMVIDADGLNIIAQHPEWLNCLPEGTILTPHLKELERIIGRCANTDERILKTLEATVRYNIYIIIKGHHSLICTPDRNVFVNPNGNAGMATAGSGDVLTGIICGLLARGYRTFDAAMIGNFLHGAAGDMACDTWGEESMTASDIIEKLGAAFKMINMKKQIL